MNKQNTQQKENKMGTMPIPRLLVSMALPMMLSMLVQALYNIVDSIFVAQINEAALTAVSLAFPVQNLMIAIASGTAVGVNALLSRSLGEKKFDIASKAANNGIFVELCSYLLFAVFGIFASYTFFSIQTSDAQIVQYGHEYLSVITIFSFGLFLQVTLERLLQSTGKSVYSMITQLTGAVTNLILDPILIFGLFGMPKLGVTGAAVATVAGQIIAASLALYFNLRVNHEITISAKGFRPNGHIIRVIYAVGIPSIIMIAISSVMTFGYNKILLVYSSTAAAVFGVYFKLNSFIFMPVFGLNNGMIPIIAYNYGARNKKRIMHTIRLSVTLAVCIMLVGLAIFEFFPDKLLLMFNASEDMLAIGEPALRIIAISFSFAGYCIILGSVFQALGKAMYSLINSFIRQLVILLPAAYILARVGGLTATWWSFPIAEICSVILSTYFMISVYKQIIKPLDTPAK